MAHTWEVFFFKSVDSTNNYANTLLSENQDFEECVISTYEQTQGRGQSSNKWHSQKGQNLTISLLLKPRYLEAQRQFALSQSIALGIVDLLKAFSIDAAIKWPNDILVNEKKIAGTLIENSVMGNYLYSSIVGIGLNVNQCEFEKMNKEPTSIKLLTGKEQNCELLLENLTEILFNRIDVLKRANYRTIQEEYLEKLFRLHQPSSFQDSAGMFTGTIIGVSEFGELIVEKQCETRKYTMQEIKYVY